MLLEQTAIYIFVIILGYVLKCVGVLKSSDKKILGNIVLNITLPAVLISSFSGVGIDFWFITSFVVGIICNMLMVCTAYIFSSRQSSEVRAVHIANGAGLSIGSGAIPFLQGIVPAGIPYLCMFDIGTALFTLGITYALAAVQIGKRSGNVIRQIIDGLIKSVPFDVYVVMIILSISKISLPSFVLNAADFVGRGNGFLAMLMVGVSIDFHMDKTKIKQALSILCSRYLVGAIVALVMCFVLPAPVAMRQAISAAAFSAVPPFCVIYTSKLGIDTEVSSAAVSLSTILSLPIMAAVLAMML